MLRFFIYALNNPGLWPQILFYIQTIINNTSSSSAEKTPNKIAYNFFPHFLLDLLAAFPTPNALAAYADAAKVTSFALLNQKLTYNRKHQLLLIKVGE